MVPGNEIREVGIWKEYMKAIVYEKYGPPEVLRLKEVEKPTPKDDELLIKVYAASINYIDWQVLTGTSYFIRLTTGSIRKPKHQILGDDLAGRVEAVGRLVKKFQPGDEVFGISNFDAFAEYACVSENDLVLKSPKMTFEEAAAMPEASTTALQGLRDKGKIKSGQKVLIIGASGGVGTFAVQIAKSYGAEVTGVCSERKVELVRSIGADHVIDYSKADFTQNGQRYDLIFAIGGNHSVFDFKRALKPDGIYVCAGGTMSQYFQAALLGPLISMTGSKKICAMFANPNQKDYESLIELFESGKVVPVIDKRFPLSEVPEALRYYGGGHSHGKVVITLAQRIHEK